MAKSMGKKGTICGPNNNKLEKSLNKTHDLSNPILMSVKGTNKLTIFLIF